MGSAGRPKVITPKIVSLLVTSFHNGLTVREACWQSGISHEAYYSRLRSDEQFADTMAKAQSDISIAAKVIVAKEIRSGSVSAAKWWLERHTQKDSDAKENEVPEELNEQQIVEDIASLDRLIALRENLKDDQRRGYISPRTDWNGNLIKD